MAAANARRLLAAGACSLIGVRARIARRRGSRGDASAHVPRVSMLVGRHGARMSMLSRAEACTRLREREHAWSGAIVTVRDE